MSLEQAPEETSAPSEENLEAQGEQATVEEVKPQEDEAAKRFAELARRERAIREKTLATTQKEKELEEKWKLYEEYEKKRESAKLDPLGYLEASGLTFQQITDKILEDQDLSPEQKAEKIAEAKIKEYDAAIKKQAAEEKAQREAEALAQKEAELIEGYKKSIAEVTADAEKFELISHEGQDARDLVFEVASLHFDKTGEIIDPSIAAEHVEKYLEDKYKKALALKKLKPEPPTETQKEDPKEISWVEERKPARTLTNKSTVYPVAAKEMVQTYLSDDESKAETARYLEKLLASKK